MGVKRLQRHEVKEALRLVWNVFEEFEAPDYAQEGITEFRRFIEYSSIIGKFDQQKLLLWGYFHENGELLGVIATRSVNHISLLFVKKAYHRRGIARCLVQTVIEACLCEGADEITVNSSLYAVGAYHHLGFLDTKGEQLVNGIKFVPMTYRLK